MCIESSAGYQPRDAGIRASQRQGPIFVEISRPWPPNEANILEPATWRLEVLVVGDNITPERSFVSLSFDGTWPKQEELVWERFLVHGPIPKMSRPP